mmetsp:Transcript_3656/g.10944  ORF Transcript_3656/g.10944 Transcript_3656/m.10944 type:complete len:81 (+) Transcript_3656:70-312(+)
MFAGLTAGEIAGRRPWELVRATLGAMLVFSAAKTSFGGNRGGDNVRVKISAAKQRRLMVINEFGLFEELQSFEDRLYFRS